LKKNENILREGPSKMDLIKYDKLQQKLTPSLNNKIIAERQELNKLIVDYNNRNIVPPKPVVLPKDPHDSFYSKTEPDEI